MDAYFIKIVTSLDWFYLLVQALGEIHVLDTAVLKVLSMFT